MRKIVLSMMVSVDGYVENPNPKPCFFKDPGKGGMACDDKKRGRCR
ncbi:MAG: hypothetical protein MI921_18040 [Cytophagales bacterium]|nr:hypothetical protein [Cytophagales bacterium]